MNAEIAQSVTFTMTISE